MSAPKSRATPPANRPMPTVWSDRVRGQSETALDTETSISLACHLNHSFVHATDWCALVAELAVRGFSLRFEGSRLVLVNDSTGLPLCTCASLGHSFATLAARLGKPSVSADSGRLILKTRP